VILYCSITAFLNAITSFVLGVSVIVRRTPGNPNAPFFFFAMAVAGWSGAYFFWQISDDAAAALFWVRTLSVLAIFTLPTCYHFSVRLAGTSRNTIIVVGYVCSAVAAAMCFSPLICVGVAPLHGFAWWPRAGPLYWFYLLVFFTFMLAGWAEMFAAFRTAGHARRNQLKFVLGGTAIGFLGGATNFPYWYEIPIPPIGNGLVALYVLGSAYSIIRHRLLEVNYVVTKLVAYTLAAIPLTVIYPTVFLGLEKIFPADRDAFAAKLAVSFVFALVSFAFLSRIKLRLDGMLDRTLLKPYVTGRDRLREFAFEIAGMKDEEDMFSRTVEVVSGALDAPATLFIRGELDTVYRKRASRGHDIQGHQPFELLDSDLLVEAARGDRRAHVLEEVKRLNTERSEQIEKLRVERQTEVIVPVHADDAFYGLLCLGPRRRYRLYSDLELSTLEAIALQLGLHLRARQLERRANQTEKLISLGTLAAGLAHELRNPLVSIKTFAQLLEENPADAEIQREFSATVHRDVGRIESIIENVSAFATDRKVAFNWLQVEAVVRAAADIVRPSLVESGTKLEMSMPPVPPVHGNHNQLTQVVLNLLNNAVQAFHGREGGVIRIEVSHRDGSGANPAVEIAVSDNGPGIDPEVLPRLFEPFTTTKNTGDRARKGGMGLGLAIVKRIVDGHNGIIRVDSRKGEGTTFTVVLPCEGHGE
jgi:two-component system nitrogen regulation sensor histidine kinase GlnL